MALEEYEKKRKFEQTPEPKAKVKKSDDKITDDELAPLVFQNDKLIGQGWDFFKKEIKH